MYFIRYVLLPFAARCVMSVSPRLIGPPQIDLVLGRLGDDTPKHQASSIRISQTTAIIANSITYRTNMSRSDDPCNPAQKRKNGTAAAAFTASHRNRCSHLGHLIDQSSALSPPALLLRLLRLLPAIFRPLNGFRF